MNLRQIEDCFTLFSVMGLSMKGQISEVGIRNERKHKGQMTSIDQIIERPDDLQAEL